MKRFLLSIITAFFICSSVTFGMYDFCESPADYNMAPHAYDVRTEYWKDIPDYHSEKDNVKFENMENNHPTFPLKFKKKNHGKDKIEK